MKRHGSRRRTKALIAAAAATLSLTAASPVIPSEPAPPPGNVRSARQYTLLDPSLELPPLEVLAPDLMLVARQLGNEAPAPRPAPHPERAVKWRSITATRSSASCRRRLCAPTPPPASRA
jgi:hypothetical protein